MKTEDNQILMLSMQDTVRHSKMAFPIIIAFELYMIVNWMVNVEGKYSVGGVGYMVCYVVLLVITVASLLYINRLRRNFEKNYHKLDVVQHVYSLIFMAWATCFTYIGSEYRNNFDYLLFVTVVTIIPLFCFLRPWFWMTVQLFFTICIIFMASRHDHFLGFVTNFMVFTIISMAAGWSIHRTRLFSYLRQIELEQERNTVYEMARKDSLTGLPNRQSYKEALEKLKRGELPENLIVMMLDVNGLKRVNDNRGHAAGDELLRGAAACMQKAFAVRGTIYRVGGDEFAGILYAEDAQLEEMLQHFERLTADWKGTLVNEVSVAVGTAIARRYPTEAISTLVTRADNNMYENKREHYASEGR